MEQEKIETCKGYLKDDCQGVPVQSGVCEQCGESWDFDVASDLYKDEYGVRPRHWKTVEEARAYMVSRRAKGK